MLESRRTAGRLKLMIAKAMCSPLVARALVPLQRHRIKSHGLTFDTADPAFTARMEAELFFGLYENAEIRFVRTHLVGQSTVIDLGSSLGVISAHILDVMDPDGTLICVEANPELIPNLEATFARHRKNQNVEVVNAAIASKPVRLKVRSSLGSHLAEDGIRIPHISLAELVRSRGLRDYAMSCDIEGAESDFVFGDTSGLDECRLGGVTKVTDVVWACRVG